MVLTVCSTAWMRTATFSTHSLRSHRSGSRTLTSVVELYRALGGGWQHRVVSWTLGFFDIASR